MTSDLRATVTFISHASMMFLVVLWESYWRDAPCSPVPFVDWC